MRNFINLIERMQPEWPPELIQALEEYQDYVSHDEVWTDARHGWQKALIAFMRENPHHVDGMLYRGTVVSDDVAEALYKGQDAVHTKGESLLESWSKTKDGALGYVGDNELKSYVLMAIPAAKLRVVCDIDQVPMDITEDHEVLVVSEDRRLSPKDVAHVIWHDYANTGETFTR